MNSLALPEIICPQGASPIALSMAATGGLPVSGPNDMWHRLQLGLIRAVPSKASVPGSGTLAAGAWKLERFSTPSSMPKGNTEPAWEGVATLVVFRTRQNEDRKPSSFQ